MIAASTSQTAELARRLAYQRNYALGFLALFVAGIVYSRGNPAAQQALLVISGLYVLGAVVLEVGVRRLRGLHALADSTRERLERELRVIERTLWLNRLWGVVSFPLIAVCALVLGYAWRHQGVALADLFARPNFLVTALGSLAVLMPLAYFLGDRMTRAAFGRPLDELRANVYALRKLGDLDEVR